MFEANQYPYSMWKEGYEIKPSATTEQEAINLLQASYRNLQSLQPQHGALVSLI